ncbi:MAG: hypothetical protein R6V10_02220 [bacterium]
MISTVLINGAVVVLLWGIAWRNHHQRIEMLQNQLERKVEREYCGLQHHSLSEDVKEIKAAQKRMEDSLEDIKIRLARRNGRRRIAEDGP